MCFSDTVSMVVPCNIWTECCHLDKNMFMVLAFGWLHEHNTGDLDRKMAQRCPWMGHRHRCHLERAWAQRFIWIEYYLYRTWTQYHLDRM